MKINFREPVNTITHILGIIAGVIFLIILNLKVSQHPSISAYIGVSVFALATICLYSASSIYHGVNTTKEKLMIYKKIDHIMIFVLISGTYTPVCLISLDSNYGIPLLITVWVITLGGIIFKLFWIGAPRWLYTLLYVLMGWACVWVFPNMIKNINSTGLFYLAMGGILYTIGALIYALKKTSLKIKYFDFHEIFHLFVLGGTLAQFISIYFYMVK